MWGKHLVVDMKGSDLSKYLVTDKNNIVSFVRMMVDAIGMNPYGEPIVEYFAKHNKKVAGYTLVQLIETSSITGHFVDINGDGYIDIFSCKSFSTSTAIKIINEYFKPTSIKTTTLERKA